MKTEGLPLYLYNLYLCNPAHNRLIALRTELLVLDCL